MRTAKPKPQVETIGSGQHEPPQALADVIFEAFEDLPPSRFLVPDRRTAKLILPRTFALDVEDTQAHGTVYTTSSRKAVALWWPKSGEYEPAPGPDERLEQAAGAFVINFEAFYETLAARHPVGRAYHYLWIVAVEKASQHRGLGTRVLTVHHDYLDEIGMLAYLEAANLRLREYYRRLGYEDFGEPIILPDGVTAMYPMWREPRPIPPEAAMYSG